MPSAVPDPTGYPLMGEIWELSETDAEQVHWLERGYECRETAVVTAAGERVNAKIYFCRKADDSPYFTPDQREEPTGDFSNAVKPNL